MTFAQRRNRLTTHFSERIPVVKRHISVYKYGHVSVCPCPASLNWRNAERFLTKFGMNVIRLEAVFESADISVAAAGSCAVACYRQGAGVPTSPPSRDTVTRLETVEL